MSKLKIDNLPDELILKVLSYLEIIDIVRCSQTSRRIRIITHDKSLWRFLRNPQEFHKEDDKEDEACFSNWNRYWRKVNLYYKRVPSNFLELVVKNKCQYLSLYETKLEDSLSLDEESQLRYLDLSGYKSNNRILEKLLESCHSLQKLSLSNKRLTTDMAYSICNQNGQTLLMLDLYWCWGVDFEAIKNIVDNCVELKQLNLAGTNLSEKSIEYLVNNLTVKMEKLSLFHLSAVSDEYIKILVRRCNRLSALDLGSTSITDDSLTSIIENLSALKEIDIGGSEEISYDKLLELNTMPWLEVLYCKLYGDDLENLKKELLPTLTISHEVRHGANAAKNLYPEHKIWEIEAEPVNLFQDTQCDNNKPTFT